MLLSGAVYHFWFNRVELAIVFVVAFLGTLFWARQTIWVGCQSSKNLQFRWSALAERTAGMAGLYNVLFYRH